MSKKRIIVTTPEELELMFKPGVVTHTDNPPSVITRIDNVIDSLENTIQSIEKRSNSALGVLMYTFVGFIGGLATGVMLIWIIS